jgi:hypothetical protein
VLENIRPSEFGEKKMRQSILPDHVPIPKKWGMIWEGWN